jgi:hypothetical protein
MDEFTDPRALHDPADGKYWYREYLLCNDQRRCWKGVALTLVVIFILAWIA